MPTPKQTRYHYKKVKNLFTRLEDALYKAHKAKVLNYVEAEYQTASPCPLVYDADHRFEECCKEALASAMKTEIMAGK